MNKKENRLYLDPSTKKIGYCAVLVSISHISGKLIEDYLYGFVDNEGNREMDFQNLIDNLKEKLGKNHFPKIYIEVPNTHTNFRTTSSLFRLNGVIWTSFNESQIIEINNKNLIDNLLKPMTNKYFQEEVFKGRLLKTGLIPNGLKGKETKRASICIANRWMEMLDEAIGNMAVIPVGLSFKKIGKGDDDTADAICLFLYNEGYFSNT